MSVFDYLFTCEPDYYSARNNLELLSNQTPFGDYTNLKDVTATSTYGTAKPYWITMPEKLIIQFGNEYVVDPSLVDVEKLLSLNQPGVIFRRTTK